MNIIKCFYENDDGEEIELTLPSIMEVCFRCHGHGYHLSPSIGEYGYSIEEFNESFHDDEDRLEYFSIGGKYDVICSSCKGKNVVAIVDEEHIPEDKREQYKEYLEYINAQCQFDIEQKMERRLGY